ncbi:MAG: lysine--tRNA ligase [Candidatus Omnitrophota bacterium]
MAEQDIMNARKEHLKWLKENSIELYPVLSGKSENIAQIKERFEKDGESFDASVSGRVTAVRLMGKAAFAEIFSNGNKIQMYIKRDEIPDDFNVFKKTDIGDFANVSGFVFKTKMGETTLHTKKFTFLCKSARPLPEKWHGLKDEEQILRKRYLDILTNERSRNNFKARSRVISGIRKFLDEREFMEVETPILHGIAGGAEAEPFTTHHNALDLDLSLRIAPELYLKRLLVAGYDRVYELGRNFRNEGISTRHNPEFTMLELYQAYSNCQGMMDLCEELIKDAALRAFPGEEPAIDINKPFRRIAVFEALLEKTGINFEGNLERAFLAESAAKLGIEFEKDASAPKIFENLSEGILLEGVTEPVFMHDFPEEFSPLAKPKPGTKIADRFELYMNGMEIANAYSELNDPAKQRENFEAQVSDASVKNIDEDFLEALEYGMPPAGGLGIGIDRLVMVLIKSASVKDVIIFPQLKKK